IARMSSLNWPRRRYRTRSQKNTSAYSAKSARSAVVPVSSWPECQDWPWTPQRDWGRRIRRIARMSFLNSPRRRYRGRSQRFLSVFAQIRIVCESRDILFGVANFVPRPLIGSTHPRRGSDVQRLAFSAPSYMADHRGHRRTLLELSVRVFLRLDGRASLA